MSASREPDPALLAHLLTALATAPTPLLIHCKDGADRTGLASALYELTVVHKSPAIADTQLSFRYGHFPWLTSHTGAMDRTFWQFVSSK
jgi:protein tyrosine/serine phosphatase